ncbi:MAG: DUF4258 domain-containing protein [Chloroflexota bacterium]
MDRDRRVFRVHAVRRMWQRGVTRADVRHVLEPGQIIESCPNDVPYPSRLVLGWHDLRPIHAVAADDSTSQVTIVITVDEPDPGEWESGYSRRKTH